VRFKTGSDVNIHDIYSARPIESGMAQQLYLEESGLQQFETTVERRLDSRVALEATAFYPTGGGQPHDTGTIEVGDDQWDVVDVEKKDTIYHRLDPIGEADTAPPEGATVRATLNWDRRRAHMRYHTAQHLLSALLLNEYAASTTGNQLYDDHAHLDCEYDRFDEADLEAIETGMNELITADRAVEWYTMDRERAEAELDTDRTRIDLLPDSIRQLRIVEIAGADGDEAPFDRTACAGTHVSSTGAIGEVIVTGRETKGSEEERIEFIFTDHR
jgi:Predicted metal-dependent hydrolases related to alanyl-tRNA synthetase HxxxH domain